jgi:hypothetical protein
MEVKFSKRKLKFLHSNFEVFPAFQFWMLLHYSLNCGTIKMSEKEYGKVI